MNKKGHILFTTILCLMVSTLLIYFNLEHRYYNQHSLKNTERGYLAQALADIAIKDDQYRQQMLYREHRDKIKVLDNDYQKKEKEVSASEQRIEELQKEKEELRNAIKEQEADLEKNQKACREIEEELEQAKKEYQSAKEELIEASSGQIEILGALATIEAAINDYEISLEEKKEEKAEKEEMIEDSKQKLEDQEEEIETHLEDVEAINRQLKHDEKKRKLLRQQPPQYPSRNYQFNQGIVLLESDEENERHCQITLKSDGYQYQFYFFPSPFKF